MKVSPLVRNALPFAVSLGLLYYLLSDFDLEAVRDRVTTERIGLLATALLCFGCVSLWVEGRCLQRLVPADAPGEVGLWTAMRIKCASYLLTTVNIALGAGALTYLLQRRSGLGLSDTAGLVMLLLAFDLSLLLGLGVFGATALATDALAAHAAALIAGAGLIAGGFALLRAPVSLGVLDRVRDLELFRAARTAPPALLVEIAALRAVLVGGFMSVFWAALVAFDVHVPAGPLVLGILGTTLVSSLPIAVSGLGTGQAAFVFFFHDWADESTLLACSLSLALGLILLRGLMGLALAGEFVREAYAGARST